MSDGTATPAELLLASWKVQAPHSAANGDIARWTAARPFGSPAQGYWPSIAWRALEWQRAGLTAAELDQLVATAQLEYKQRIAATVPLGVNRPAFYVASRATIPERAAAWRRFRHRGVRITSTWIDEAGDGETACFTELWDRIQTEITIADHLVLYAEPDDFPLKGALIEVGMALAMGRPVTVCLPGVELNGRTHRPVGSWIEHRLVDRNDDIAAALLAKPKETP